MAEAFLTVGLQPGAIELLGAAEKAAASFKRPEEKAVVLARAAKIYFDADDTLKASDLFTRATLLSRAAETPEQRAGALYQVASDLADAGLNDRASQLLSELHDLAVVPENNLDAVGELIGIAGIYTDIGQPAQAHKILAGALNLLPRSKIAFSRPGVCWKSPANTCIRTPGRMPNRS
jgi:tetratricopeptide (TPR) repeat protein